MNTLTTGQNVVQSSAEYTKGRIMPEWLSVEEASEKTGYNQEYLRRLIRNKKVKAVKKGLMWWVDPDSLDRYLKSAEGFDDARYTPRRR